MPEAISNALTTNSNCRSDRLSIKWNSKAAQALQDAATPLVLSSDRRAIHAIAVEQLSNKFLF